MQIVKGQSDQGPHSLPSTKYFKMQLHKKKNLDKTRAGVCKTLCPQLSDSNTAWLQHCLPMTVTTVQIYEISMLFY